MSGKVVKISVYMSVCLCLLVGVSSEEAEQILQRLEALESHVRKQDGRIRTLEHKVSTQDFLLQAANEQLNLYRIYHRNDSIHDKRSLQVNRAAVLKVAFSAYLDHQVDHVGIDSIIPFNKVILNDGGAYNPVTGIFTAPVTGVYLFTYSVNTVVKAYQLVVKLVLDNVNMSDGISDPVQELQEVQGGNTVMFKAKQGQSVWLAAYNTGNTIVDGRPDHRFSTFSGVLLYA